MTADTAAPELASAPDLPEPPDLRGLKVLVAGHRWPLETFLAELFDRLTGMGLEVVLLGQPWATAPFRGAPDRPPRTVLPGQLRRDAVRRLRARRGTGAAYAGWLADVRAEVLSSGADLIYFPWLGAPAGLPSLDLGAPLVVSCRGSQVNVAPWQPGREQLREGLGRVFGAAASVHCVSRAIQHEAERLGLDPARAHVIRPGVDPDRFVPPATPRAAGGRFRVVSVGALRWVKGFDAALLAIAEARRLGVDASIEIIGSGRERGALAGLIREFDLGGAATLVGPLPPHEVVARLQGADAYLLSSVAEGISNAALEAMATELPVVTTDCGGMREVIDDGVEGLVVPLRDHKAMGAALASLAADPSRAREMGRAGRRRVVAGLTSEVTARRFATMLADAASARVA